MKKLLSALRLVLVGILVLILSVNVYFIAARLAFGAQCPKIFGFSHSIVISGSMEPAFSPGDLLVYREQDSYDIGDIVIFTQGQSLVTHRIVGEGEEGFITKGDANNAEDTDILDPANIHGQMVLVIPKIGNFLLFLKTPFGFLCLLLFGALIVELPGIVKLFQGKKGEYDE